MATGGINIDTYFGFFAEAVFTAVGGSLSAQSGYQVVLDEVQLSTTNTLKLRWSNVEQVLLPRLAQKTPVPFVLALTPEDVPPLEFLSKTKGSLSRMMEQAVASAIEPFNFIGKNRNQLTGLQFSKNVTGLTAHHLAGEVSYTMAIGHFLLDKKKDFSLRLLVTSKGRDLIEERAGESHTQRALFSINQGAYLCKPQWEPPPPPPGAETGKGLSEGLLSAWMQSFFALNHGRMANKMFKNTGIVTSHLTESQAISSGGEGGPFTVVRLALNGDKAKELLVLVPPPSVRALMTLSKSGQEKFLGDFFRVWFSEAAELWKKFSGVPFAWNFAGIGQVPPSALGKITKRLDGGGMLLRMKVTMGEGEVEWYLGVSPHAWRAMLLATATQGADGEVSEENADREKIFSETGLAGPGLSWPHLLARSEERELEALVRGLNAQGWDESHMAAVAGALDEKEKKRWMAVQPVMLRERTQSYKLGEQEAPWKLYELTKGVLALNQGGKIESPRLSVWLKLFGEIQVNRRQEMIGQLLPLRHLIYGLDRGSLSKLLFSVKNEVLTQMLCAAEFSVLDQIRRAISPGFAVRLFEDVALRKPQITGAQVQEAQLVFYKKCMEGMGQGLYMVRATPANRLVELLRWLEQ